MPGSPPESNKQQLFLTLAGKALEGGVHAIVVPLFCTVGWVISQTSLAEFFGPAIKQLIFDYIAMLLPKALVPFGGWIALGTVAAIFSYPIIYAALTDTLFDQHNPNRPYGTWLYVGASWILPIAAFTFWCAHGVGLGSALLSTALLTAILGPLTAVLVPFLDNPQFQTMAKQILNNIKDEQLVPGLKYAYEKGKRFTLDTLVPGCVDFVKEKIYPFLERFFPDPEQIINPPEESAPLPPTRFDADSAPLARSPLPEVADPSPDHSLSPNPERLRP
jgi:hypothetical protein